MLNSRLFAVATLAASFIIPASSSASANSEINEIRKLRRDFCQSLEIRQLKTSCNQVTVESLRTFRSEHRKCMRDPRSDTITCDNQLAENLDSLLAPIRGQD
jgi:hypothetical protein